MLLIDGMNLIGARPDGWWKDRGQAMRLLAWELRAYAEDTGEQLTVVFDGRPIPEVLRGHGIKVQFAPGGANAADRRIEDLVSGQPEPASVTVVTSDKALVRAVTEAGAGVIGSGEFRDRLDELDGRRDSDSAA